MTGGQPSGSTSSIQLRRMGQCWRSVCTMCSKQERPAPQPRRRQARIVKARQQLATLRIRPVEGEHLNHEDALTLGHQASPFRSRQHVLSG